MMIKHEGKMVPAKKVNGKWVPSENEKLVITKDGLRLESESATPTTEEPEEKKGFLDKLLGK